MRNVASGNGLAGITIHQHSAGDLNGNVLVDSFLSNDNPAGDNDFATVDAATTGILVASGPTPAPLPPPGSITGTVICGNVIVNVTVGIWTLNTSPATNTIAGNFLAPASRRRSAHTRTEPRDTSSTRSASGRTLTHQQSQSRADFLRAPGRGGRVRLSLVVV